MCGSRRNRSVKRSPRSTNSPIIKVSAPHNSRLFNNEVEMDLIYCFTCEQGSENKFGNYCERCGSKLIKCAISKNYFKISNEFSQCTNCNSVFHYFHLDNWLKQSNICPICRIEMREIARGRVGVNNILN